jgi:hypothetical protein
MKFLIMSATDYIGKSFVNEILKKVAKVLNSELRLPLIPEGYMILLLKLFRKKIDRQRIFSSLIVDNSKVKKLLVMRSKNINRLIFLETR